MKSAHWLLSLCLLLACSCACVGVQAQVAPTDSTNTGGKGAIKILPSDSSEVSEGKKGLKGQPADSIAHVPSLMEREKPPVGIERDSVRAAKKAAFLASRDPNKAVYRSLLIPGWGQAYNRKYWKIPIIYAGFATFTYFIVDNHKQYKIYNEAMKCKAYGTCPDLYPEYSEDNLITIREFHRKYRDLNVILAAVWYSLQAIDAYVDGHMAAFDVSDDLGLQVSPHLQFDPWQNRSLYSGLTLNFRLKR